MSIWQIIKAEYLTNEEAPRNWVFVLMVVLMGIYVINLSHEADQKVKEITKLTKDVKALSSEAVDLKTQVIKRKMATDVYIKLKDQGFVFPKKRPVKISVKN